MQSSTPSPLASSHRGGNYRDVTELAGASATRDQLHRMCNRYYFAGQFCRGRDVLEVACGPGQGLGYLARLAKSVVGIDIDPQMVSAAQTQYGHRLEVRQGNAEALEFPDRSFDVVVHYEAIYYLAAPDRFAREVRRVLRPGGMLLIGTANKDLPDFNPSPFTFRYFGPPELASLLEPQGFVVECFGDSPVDARDTKARLLRKVKRLAAQFHLIPETMRGKELIKRIVFGPLIQLPPEIKDGMTVYQAPKPIPSHQPDFTHRVLFAVARLAK